MRFRPEQHLLHRAQFEIVRRHGYAVDAGACLIRFYRREDSHADTDAPRLGLIATRKIGNAVVRNRAKRLFREIFRIEQRCLPPGTDVVVLIRPHFRKFAFGELRARFFRAAERYASHLSRLTPPAR